MKTLHTIYTNFAKRVLITLIALTTIGVGTILAAGETGTISFGTNDVKINAASVTAQDNLDNIWTITTTGTDSYPANGSYYQVGKKDDPAETITFTTTLPQSVNITNFSATFGGFSSTAGNITLKVGETVVGSGNLNEATDVMVESSSTATGTVLTVTVTDIDRGVKCYSISYTYEIDVPEYNVYWVANNEQISADVVEQESRVTLPSKPADCSNNVVFVGWTAQNNVNGAKPDDLFNGSTPLLQLPTIDEETTFRAVYAEVVDGVGTFAAGESGTFKLYAIVNGNNYYAGTGIDDRKLTSTTAIANAGDYTITHISDDQYTIQYGNQYISHVNGEVDLQYLEYDDANQSKCRWIITRTGTKGTWRVASPVDHNRALAFTTNSNVFKAYATSNITADGDYYDLEIGNGEAISYQNYTTTCTTDVTVTLDPNGGTGDFNGWYEEVNGNYTKTVEKGNSVTLPTLNDQTAYTFGGWSDGTNTYTSEYTPQKNITLTAQWTPIQYDITYHLYGGTNHASNPANYTIETSTITLQAPTKTGYTFGGWYKEDAFTTPVTEITEGSTGNIPLHAQWTPNPYTVQFNANGGTGTMDSQPFTYDVAQNLSANTFTWTGYNFTGWNTADDGTGTPYADKAEVQNLTAAANGVVTLYAQWTAKNLINYRTLCTYNIEYTNLEGATHTNPNTYTAADLPLIFTAPSAREGYTFAGWNPETLTAETRGDQEVEAQWTVNQYTVTWKLNGGQWQGGGTDDRVNNHNYGAEVTKPVDPSRTGYTFTGWSPAEIPATMPAENLEFTAQWTPTPYTVTWMLGGTEHATSTVNIENPLSTAPDNPSDGDLGCCADKFMGWSSQQSPSAGDIFTEDNIPSNVTTDKIYYAVFATAAQGVGTSIADFSEMGYENGTAVTEPIVLGDGEGRGDATITLEKAQSSSNAPTYYTDGEAVRIYAGGTITIESTYAGATIKNITFEFGADDGVNAIIYSTGEYSEGIWTGDANSVTFTISGSTGHRRIASITVTTGVSGSQYTNYVTQCTTLPNPALSDGSVPAIAVNCGDFSTLSNSQAIVFSTMQNLTCPVTFEVIEGDFLISTARNRAAQYQSKVKVVPYKTGENLGKLRNVYVRANATDHNENFTGQIKVTSDEITKDVIIDLIATVTCDKFTLTTVDHLGNETEFGTYFAGEVIDTEPTPSSDECTAGYTFDGWSTSAVEYGSLIYNKVSFPFTMPAENVTLIPVYRVNPTEDYHRVTSDLGAGDVDGNNWAGDYLIAASADIFASGQTNALLPVEPNDLPTIIDEVISAGWGQAYDVSLIAVEGGYVLKTQDDLKPYIYITDNGTEGTPTDDLTKADDYPLTITWDEESKKITIHNAKNTKGYAINYSSQASPSRFGFFKATSIYLYKKSPLYTSSLICEEITAEDAMVTSTVDQTVKVNVTATMSGMTVDRKRTLTVESDNEDFTATITPTATENEYNVAVSYAPSAEDDTDGTETATITIKVNDNPVTTFQVTGRHLPENFVIAAKAGGEWVALTAKVSNGTQVAVPIIVDDKTAPTKAIVALNTCQYKLLGLTTKNRFDVNGTAVHLYSTQTEKVLNASTASGTSTYLNTGAIHENAETSPNALFYEWQLVTEDLKKYTITNSNTTNTSNTRLGYSAATGQWGMYVNNVNVNQELYLLPIESHFTELNVEVMEWGTNSMALRIDGTAPSKLDVTLGENTNTVTLANLNSGNISDIYKAEGIDLTTNDCEIMKIVDNANPNSGTLIRKPILVNTTEAVSSTYRTELTDDYCAHCDIVILKDAKLTADQGINDHTSFAKIYVYPGGKLVLDAKSLGVKQQVYLRGGYSWLNSEYALPELYLNGTINFNGSGNIIYDYYIQNYKYYQFALPYDVQLAKVTDEAGIDNFPVWVKHYNGALRALDPHATSWEWYPSENGNANAYFKAGEGYIIAAQPRQVGNTANRPLSIIRFPLGNSVISSAEADKSIATTAHGIDAYKAGTITANNVGWNFIGNPFMATWKGDIGYKQLTKHPNEANWDGTYHWVDSNIKYITIMSAESGSDYYQYTAADTELKPFFPFYIQETADGGTGTINFAAANRIQKAPAMLSAETPREAFVQIEIEAESIVDQTGMFIGDRYSDNIDFDDYEKMFGSSTDKPKVWLMHEDKRMAFEAMTESKAAAYTTIGYRAPQTGKYMFAINEEASKLSDVEAVYLTDNQTGVTDFDLLSSAYEFESNGELYNDSRFTIHIVLRDESPGTTTGVGNLLHFNSEQPMKFIYQDKMYILQNGVIYDAMGKQVQTINK